MTERVLVIEDDEMIAQLVKDTLELEGYQVITTLDGKTGLKKIAEESPDLVILDVVLPGIDGWEVLFQIKENPLTANMPVIMLTGKVDSISKVFGLKHGADDYVTKPFDPQELVARCGVVLRRTTSKSTPKARTGGVLNRIPAEAGKKTFLVSLQDIFYIQAKYNYACVYTDDKELLSKATLNDLEEQLRDSFFWRTHRSYIVNLGKIKEVIKLPKSELLLVLNDKGATKIPVARSKKEEIKKLLNL